MIIISFWPLKKKKKKNNNNKNNNKKQAPILGESRVQDHIPNAVTQKLPSPSSSLLLACRIHPYTPCNYSFDTLVGERHLSNPQLDQLQCHYLVHRTLVMIVVPTDCWLQPCVIHSCTFHYSKPIQSEDMTTKSQQYSY